MITMDRKELMVWIASILTTLAETDGSPESTIYLAMGMDLQRWSDVKGVLLRMTAIEVSGYFVTLTPKGKALADEITLALVKGK